MEQPEQTPNRNKTRLRLPFERKNQDIGEWSYDHRFGLCITVIVVLLLAIVFISSKIKLGGESMVGGIVVDMEDLAKIEQFKELEKLKNDHAPTDADFNDVKNLTSNENAKFNEKLKDDRGTNASEIYDQAQKAQDRLNSNRDLYEQGLKGSEATRPIKSITGKEVQKEDSKVKGRVTVSFSLVNPVRTERRLITPAYMCEGGGEVVIRITVNRSGDVTGATVDKSASSTSNSCMTTTAVNAALGSRFNLDTAAPERQNGTITYIFIPQ